MKIRTLYAGGRGILRPGATSCNVSGVRTSSNSGPELPPCSHVPKNVTFPTYDEMLKTRSTKLNPAYMTFYRKPLYITQGHMQYLYDNTGKRYLDFFAGIVTVSVGHCHPRVSAALRDQLDTLWHTTNVYMHPKIHEYAERLTEKLPEPLKCVYFVNSGTEANDMAMMMARLYTGNHELLSFRNSYHGMSMATMGITGQGTWKYKLPGINMNVHNIMNPDPYRGIYGGNKCRDSPVQVLGRDCDCAGGQCKAEEGYLEQLEEVLKYSTQTGLPAGKNIAGFFAESIQGNGGAMQYPKGYLKRAFKRVRELGGVCISDEVQTGFGRTGEHYWGFQGHDVVPDIVTMAKGIGNGFPIGAVVTTPEIAKVMTRANHFNTYGGNPLASAVGIAVLDAIEKDECQKVSEDIGTYLLGELAKFRGQFECIGDVRGKGLMIGVEMVNDKASRVPLAAEKMINVWEDCRDMGLLLGKGGINGNIFRIKPPMCITKEDADFALSVFKLALEKNGA